MMGYRTIGIRANHMDMTKLGSDDSPGYVRVCGELQRWFKTLASDNDKEDQKACNSFSLR
jgi:hypothetical protein